MNAYRCDAPGCDARVLGAGDIGARELRPLGWLVLFHDDRPPTCLCPADACAAALAHIGALRAREADHLELGGSR